MGHKKGILIYYVFRLNQTGDVELRGEPLKKRKDLLKRMLKGQSRLLLCSKIGRQRGGRADWLAETDKVPTGGASFLAHTLGQR